MISSLETQRLGFPPAGSTIVDVHRMVVARRGRGQPLPQALRNRLQIALNADLSRVRIHADSAAARLPELLSAAAFAAGDDIYFRSGLYAPDNPLGLWLLCHELAHVIQQRGDSRQFALFGYEAAAGLEAEANAAAFALLHGLKPLVAPRSGCPCIQANPLILIAILAGLITFWPSTTDTDDGERAVPELYETGWGYLPFVGSLDQMINGKNLVQQVAGGAFFVLDLSSVGGGSAMKSSARGMFLKLKPEVQAGLKKASQATANPATRTLLSKLFFGHNLQIGSEATIKKLLQEITSQSKEGVLLVGTQTSKGGIHHSVVYVIQGGTISKLHGSITNLAHQVIGRNTTEVVSKEFLKKFNTLSVYGPAELAKAGMTDAQLLSLVAEWSRLATGFKSQLFSRISARGCAFSQALLLERTGMLQTSGLKQYVPLLLDRARMSSSSGAHYLFRPDRALWGTAAHALAPVAGAGTYATLRDVTGAGPLRLFGNPLFHESIVAQPVSDWSPEPATHPFPDGGSFTASPNPSPAPTPTPTATPFATPGFKR